MRTVILAIIRALALPASAQTIYKCRGFKGEPVYQSFPCAGTKPAEKTWPGDYRQRTNAELWSDYYRNLEWRQRQQREQQRRASSAPYRIDRGHQTQENINRAACVATRSQYDRVQADPRLNRNVDLLRRLESEFRTFCVVRP